MYISGKCKLKTNFDAFLPYSELVWKEKEKNKTNAEVEKEATHSFLVEVLIASVTMESILEISQKLEIDQLQDPALSLLATYPRELISYYKHISVHCYSTHNSH